jgi:dTDP-4-amino-4,6-dideoxy-D-glucose acyltransferase
VIYEPCIILKPEKVKIAETARVDSYTKIEGGEGVAIGEFVHIASFSHINVGGGRVIFEDHSGCSSHCCVGSGSPDWSYLYISAAEPSEHIHTRHTLTRICSFAILFMGVIVVPGVTIAAGAVVKPGSVVTKDVAPWTIVQGNPAVKVGVRKISAYHDCDNRIIVPKRNALHSSLLQADGQLEEGIGRQGVLSKTGFGLR